MMNGKATPVTARSTALVCDRSLAGIAGSNPSGGMDAVCRTGRDFWDGSIPNPAETHRLCLCVCPWVWPRVTITLYTHNEKVWNVRLKENIQSKKSLTSVSSTVLRRLPLIIVSTSLEHSSPLKLSGYFTFHKIQHSNTLHSAHGVSVCVCYWSRNKQWLVRYTTVIGVVNEDVVRFQASQCKICDFVVFLKVTAFSSLII
jgi:hypothetical protein